MSCHTTGRFSARELSDTLEMCKEASRYVFDYYRKIVEQYANKI